eukprot:TRINITY_DN7724_c0_g1_i1.p1 TRINITY_DN7724_c0_g1~~TRINITY_DN7724_c0_g1_i1.p1  ORF type:complete len:609 (-),score=84.75 TRINITY_DN7724_c0_g1_i1:207-2033(-)
MKQPRLFTCWFALLVFIASCAVSATPILLSRSFLANHSLLLLVIIALPVIFVIFYAYFVHIWCTFFSERSTPLIGPQFESRVANPPLVSVLIPSRNEPFDVCQLTLDSVTAQDYPASIEIIWIDNSDETHPDLPRLKQYVEEQNGNGRVISKFIHRQGTDGFKPRNLDIGQRVAMGEYLLFLDVDSTIPTSMVRETVYALLNDPGAAYCLTQTVPTNAHFNSLTRCCSITQQLERFAMVASVYGGFPNFIGHNALWRRQALQDFEWEGYVALPTSVWGWLPCCSRKVCASAYREEPLVTEDFSACLTAYVKGWRGIAVWIPTGEWVPAAWKEFEGMWLRWTVGTYQIFYKNLSAIWSAELPFPVKLDLCVHVFSFVIGAFLPIYCLLTLVFYNSDLTWFQVGGTALMILMYSIRYIGFRARQRPGDEIWLTTFLWGNLSMMVAISMVNLKGTLRFLGRAKQGWRVTGKAAEDQHGCCMGLFQQRFGLLFFVLATLAGVVKPIPQLVQDTDLKNPWEWLRTLDQVLFITPAIVYYVVLLVNMMVFARATRQAENQARDAGVWEVKDDVNRASMPEIRVDGAHGQPDARMPLLSGPPQRKYSLAMEIPDA